MRQTKEAAGRPGVCAAALFKMAPLPEACGLAKRTPSNGTLTTNKLALVRERRQRDKEVFFRACAKSSHLQHIQVKLFLSFCFQTMIHFFEESLSRKFAVQSLIIIIK